MLTIYNANNSYSVPIPILVSPNNMVTDFSGALTWTFPPIPGSITYNLEINTSPSFNGIAINVPNPLSATSFNLPSLDASTEYFWRVSANTPQGQSPVTSARSFTSPDLPPVSINTPDLSGNILDFGDVLVNNDTRILPLRITTNNLLGRTIIVTSNDNRFIPNQSSLTIGVGELDTTINVTFDPTIVGQNSGILTLTCGSIVRNITMQGNGTTVIPDPILNRTDINGDLEQLCISSSDIICQ